MEAAAVRVFLSYGHDEHAAVARRLRDALRERGHEVWFDEERIEPGADWERTIDEGIAWAAREPSSGRLVLLMTPHAVRRPDGYCLNEIARALDRRVPVVPVMLVWCEPPLSICRIQWLDMRDCVPLDDHVGRYEAGARRLIEALESDRIDGEGGQSRLLRLLEPLPFDADIAQHVPHFVGRRWLLARYESWLADPRGSRALWITGSPGVGKTAFSAWLASHRPEIAALHLCRHGHVQKSDPRRCVLSIAYQLASQLPVLHDRLCRLDLERIVPESDARTLFDDLVVQPLGGSFPAPAQPLVVLIDALDEATRDGRNELAEFLAHEVGRTPSWLRLVLTSRPDPEVTHPLQALTPLVVDAHAEDNARDLRAFVKASSDGIDAATVETIVERSGGIFLYAQWVCAELRAGRLATGRATELPQGLGGAYAQLFARRFPDAAEYRRTLRPALETIAAARGPLPWSLLSEVLAWDEYGRADFRASVGSLFADDGDHVRPFHQSVLDWLTSARAGAYHASAAAGHRRLSVAGDRWRDLAGLARRYALAHRLGHALAAERVDAASAAVADLEWHLARLAELGPSSVAELARDARSWSHPPELACEWLRFFRERAHILVRGGTEAALQLAASESDDSPITCAAEAHVAREPPSGTWLSRIGRPPRAGASPCVRTIDVDGWVESLAVDRAARRVYVGTRGWMLHAVDLDTGEEVARVEAHRGAVHALVVTSEQRIASGGGDGFVRIWDDRLRPIAELQRHGSPVTALAMACDGRLWSASAGTLRVWRDTELQRVINAGKVRGVTSAPDAPWVVSWGDGYDVRIWDAQDGRLVRRVRGVSAKACAVAGDTVAIGRTDGRIELHAVSSGSRTGTLTGHRGAVRSLVFLGDRRLASGGSSNGTLRVWDLATVTAQRRFDEHSDWVTALAAAPDGRVASGSADGTVRLWDLTPVEASDEESHREWVSSVSFHPAHAWVASTSGDGTVKLWDPRTGRCTGTLACHRSAARTVALCPDGAAAVTLGERGTLKIWDLRSGDQSGQVEVHRSSARWLALSPDGKVAVCVGAGGGAAVVDLERRAVARKLAGHEGTVRAAAITASGLAVTAGDDRTIRVWRLADGTPAGELRGHEDAVVCLAVCPEGRRVVSGSWDRTARVWDLSTGRCERVLAGHAAAVHTVSVEPAGARVITGGADRTLRVWDLATGARLATWWADADVTASAFAGEGLVVLGDRARRVTLVRVTSSRQVAIVDGVDCR